MNAVAQDELDPRCPDRNRYSRRDPLPETARRAHAVELGLAARSRRAGWRLKSFVVTAAAIRKGRKWAALPVAEKGGVQ